MKQKEGVLSGYAILRHFERQPEGITIRQLAISIKQSYGWTNMHVHDLAQKGVVRVKKVGPSIMVELNTHNALCLALLAVVATERIQEAAFEEVRKVADDPALANARMILVKDGIIYAISNAKGHMRIGNNDVHLIHELTPDLHDATPVHGAELFYKQRVPHA